MNQKLEEYINNIIINQPKPSTLWKKILHPSLNVPVIELTQLFWDDGRDKLSVDLQVGATSGEFIQKNLFLMRYFDGRCFVLYFKNRRLHIRQLKISLE